MENIEFFRIGSLWGHMVYPMGNFSKILIPFYIAQFFIKGRKLACWLFLEAWELLYVLTLILSMFSCKKNDYSWALACPGKPVIVSNVFTGNLSSKHSSIGPIYLVFICVSDYNTSFLWQSILLFILVLPYSNCKELCFLFVFWCLMKENIIPLKLMWKFLWCLLWSLFTFQN